MQMIAQSRARILLIEAQGVTLMRWQRGALRLFAQYKPQSQDFRAFENLLHMEARVPFIVVIDCIEEDFRMESVAHVTGADRTAMLERKLSFAFRNTPYKIARVVGREKEGRKDDRVLMTALTKAELLEPWTSRILKEKLAIQCITSAAYMMELLAESAGVKSKPHVLLTNIEYGSGMRQTYLQKGRVIFSRLTPIGDRQHADLATMLLEQSVQTRKYLERIKQVPYDARLPVHVVLPAGMTIEIPESSAENQIDFAPLQAEQQVSPSAFSLGEIQPGALAVSLVQALRRKGLKNVYATPVMRRFFLLRRFSSSLYATAVAALLTGLVLAAPVLSETIGLWEREAQTALQTLPLQQQYENLRSSFPETPISSSTMELVVSTFDVLREQVGNPNFVLTLIGNALLDYPTLQLETFDWELEVQELTEEEIAMGMIDPEDDTERFYQRILAGRTMLVTTITGQVQGVSSFRDARDNVLSFIETLERTPGIRVNALQMPIDVRAESAVATVVNDAVVNEAFSLQILQERIVEEVP